MKDIFLNAVLKNVKDALSTGSDFMNEYEDTYEYKEQIKYLLMDRGFDEVMIDELEPEIDYEVKLEGFKESAGALASAMENGYKSADTNLSPEEYVSTYIIDYLIEYYTPILSIEVHVEPEDFM